MIRTGMKARLSANGNESVCRSRSRRLRQRGGGGGGGVELYHRQCFLFLHLSRSCASKSVPQSWNSDSRSVRRSCHDNDVANVSPATDVGVSEYTDGDLDASDDLIKDGLLNEGASSSSDSSIVSERELPNSTIESNNNYDSDSDGNTSQSTVIPAVRECTPGSLVHNSSLCVDEGALLVQDDLDLLLQMLPVQLRHTLREHPNRSNLLEVVMDLGRRPEARFLSTNNGSNSNIPMSSLTGMTGTNDASRDIVDTNDSHRKSGSDNSKNASTTLYLREAVVTSEELEQAERAVGDFGGDNRAGVPLTLHRISAIRNRKGTVIGLTCRVGRAVTGHIDMIRDLLDEKQSILFLGPPGVGKTTVIREMARVIADDMHSRVVIVDTSNEIGGDGDVPHPAIGGARRMQVSEPSRQHHVMIEAVQNHMPEVIIVDEVGTETECIACRSIAERGVKLVATAHGHTLRNLLKNPSINDLIGGIESVTLGDDEARARGSRKTVLERKGPATFPIVIEMRSRTMWVVHKTENSVDNILLDKIPMVMIRSRESESYDVKTMVMPYEDDVNDGGLLGDDHMLQGSNEENAKLGSQRVRRISPLDALDNPALAATYQSSMSIRMKDNRNAYSTSPSAGNGSRPGRDNNSNKSKKKNDAKRDPYSWVDNLESLQSLHSGNGSGNGSRAVTNIESYGNSGYEIIAELTNDFANVNEVNNITNKHGIAGDFHSIGGDGQGFLDVRYTNDYEPTEKRRREKKKKNKN